MTRRALVLAGGGYVASSWEIGLIAGLTDAGVDLRNADLLVGTSAGARVAIDLASGLPFETFYDKRITPDGSGPERPGAIDHLRIRDGVAAARQAGGTKAEILKRYGALALEVATGTGSDRRAAVSQQIPIQSWPEQHLQITAVSAQTGARRTFDRNSGIDLVDAVIATTAALGSAPLLFDGQHYIDGGYHSSDNADLATGYDIVLILALRSPPQAMRLVSIDEGVAALRNSGSAVEVVHPDAEVMAALEATGGQMNPASGRPAAIAGRHQGQREAARIKGFWA